MLSNTLFAGLSGMNVAQAKLNVVGNNIANANTVAFKSSRALIKPQFYVTDTAGSQTRYVGMQVGRPLQIGGQVDRVGIVSMVLTQCPGQIIVPVDQRRALQDAAGAGRVGVLCQHRLGQHGKHPWQQAGAAPHASKW